MSLLNVELDYQINFIGTFVYLFYVYGCFTYVHTCLCTTCIPGPSGGQKRVLDPLGTGVLGGCELLCGCWV